MHCVSSAPRVLALSAHGYVSLAFRLLTKAKTHSEFLTTFCVLQKIYREIDVDKSGTMNSYEMRRALEAAGICIHSIIEWIGLEGNPEQLTEFLAAYNIFFSCGCLCLFCFKSLSSHFRVQAELPVTSNNRGSFC